MAYSSRTSRRRTFSYSTLLTVRQMSAGDAFGRWHVAPATTDGFSTETSYTTFQTPSPAPATLTGSRADLVTFRAGASQLLTMEQTMLCP